jgi:hypothetical protein
MVIRGTQGIMYQIIVILGHRTLKVTTGLLGDKGFQLEFIGTALF